MSRKPRVLLIQEIMQRYRAPIYKLMSKEVDLDLAYTEKNDIDDPEFNVFQFPHFKLWKFNIHTGIYKILNKYDIVIMQPHLNCLTLNSIPFLPHKKFKIVTWTIGKYVTYNIPYDLEKKPSLKDWIFENIQDAAQACIFYMPEPIEYWKKHKNIDTRKYFVAHNTVEVAEYDKLPAYKERDSFLFVGTLYRQKGINELIEAYNIAKTKGGNLPKLNIVGKGAEEQAIREQIKELNLENDIILCGAVYDENILKDYFLNAKLCISPKQAGLSVPKSLGYGCPFITRPNAITGGERNNIIDGHNGVYYNSVEELAEILVASVENEEKYSTMADNARTYYHKMCPPQKMADGALEAIRYVLENSK